MIELRGQLQKYPKAAEAFYSFMETSLKELQKRLLQDIPEGVDSTIPEISKDIVKPYAESVLTTNHRVLYDFFDSVEVWIVIDYDYDRKDSPEWFHRIQGETSAYFNSRIETEIAAFTKAFAILENILKENAG